MELEAEVLSRTGRIKELGERLGEKNKYKQLHIERQIAHLQAEVCCRSGRIDELATELEQRRTRKGERWRPTSAPAAVPRVAPRPQTARRPDPSWELRARPRSAQMQRVRVAAPVRPRSAQPQGVTQPLEPFATHHDRRSRLSRQPLQPDQKEMLQLRAIMEACNRRARELWNDVPATEAGSVCERRRILEEAVRVYAPKECGGQHRRDVPLTPRN